MAALAGSVSAAEDLFVEDDGMVVIEIESHPPSSGWSKETAVEGFAGDSYYVWKGGNRYGGASGDALTYRILITTPGTYGFRYRTYRDHPEGDKANDAFVRMDGGAFVKCFANPPRQWTWNCRFEPNHGKFAEAEYELGAGLHVLEICGRSEGFGIDRIHLSRADVDRKRAEDPALPETRGLPPMPEFAALTVAAAWEKGRLGAALGYAEARTSSEDAKEAAEAKQAVEVLTAHVQKRKDQIEATRSTDPLGAVDLITQLSKVYQGSSAGDALRDLTRTWSSDPAVAKEKQARRILQAVEAKAASIRQDGKVDDHKFAKRYQGELAFIAAAVQKLRRSYPESWSLKRAETIAGRYGLPVGS